MGTRSARAHKVTWGRMGRGRAPAGLGVTSTWNWLFWRGEGGQRGKSEFGCLPPLPPAPRCRAKSSQSPVTHLMVLLYQLCVSGTRVWAASHPVVRAGEDRLHSVRRGGSRSLVPGAGAWWSRLGPCQSLASASRGPCGGVICFSLPYCPNFKKLTRLFRKFFFITLRKQFVSVLLFSVFFLFCVLCQLICNSLALVSDLKLTQVILELA